MNSTRRQWLKQLAILFGVGVAAGRAESLEELDTTRGVIFDREFHGVEYDQIVYDEISGPHSGEAVARAWEEVVGNHPLDTPFEKWLYEQYAGGPTKHAKNGRRRRKLRKAKALP